MKKLFILAIITFLGTVNYSCSKDDKKTESAELIIGKWNAVSSTYDGTDSGVPDRTPIVFAADNRVTFTYLGQGINGQDINDGGKWQKTGNILKVTWDTAAPGEEISTFTITELTPNSLKWQSITDSSNKILTENFNR